jgi:hypothetical protein
MFTATSSQWVLIAQSANDTNATCSTKLVAWLCSSCSIAMVGNTHVALLGTSSNTRAPLACCCSLALHALGLTTALQSTTRVKPFITTMPMRLDEGWNQIQFNLADFTRRAYGACSRALCL